MFSIASIVYPVFFTYSYRQSTFPLRKVDNPYTIQCMRQINSTLLTSIVISKGKLGRETLAVESKISFVKIDRLCKGTKKTATDLEMESLCKATGHSMDELFPVCEMGKKSA